MRRWWTVRVTSRGSRQVLLNAVVGPASKAHPVFLAPVLLLYVYRVYNIEYEYSCPSHHTFSLMDSPSCSQAQSSVQSRCLDRAVPNTQNLTNPHDARSRKYKFAANSLASRASNLKLTGP
jgi:hypothetical protein